MHNMRKAKKRVPVVINHDFSSDDEDSFKTACSSSPKHTEESNDTANKTNNNVTNIPSPEASNTSLKLNQPLTFNQEPFGFGSFDHRNIDSDNIDDEDDDLSDCYALFESNGEELSSESESSCSSSSKTTAETKPTTKEVSTDSSVKNPPTRVFSEINATMDMDISDSSEYISTINAAKQEIPKAPQSDPSEKSRELTTVTFPTESTAPKDYIAPFHFSDIPRFNRVSNLKKYLEGLSLTEEEKANVIKYGVLTKAALNCNFNPGKQGCSISFPTQDIGAFLRHLELFHMVDTEKNTLASTKEIESSNYSEDINMSPEDRELYETEAIVKTCDTNKEIIRIEHSANDNAVDPVIAPQPKFQLDCWAIEKGYGYYMGSKFYCNVTRSKPPNGCKLLFGDLDSFLRHLDSIHCINKLNVDKLTEGYNKQDLVEKSLCNLIATTGVPSSFINNDTFTDLLRVLQRDSSEVAIPDPSKVEEDVENQFRELKQKIKQILQETKYVSLSINIWHPPPHIHDEQILFVTVFFIDDRWMKRHYLLAVEPLGARPTSDSVNQRLVKIMLDYSILDKVYSITCIDCLKSPQRREQLLEKMTETCLAMNSRNGNNPKTLCITNGRVFNNCLDNVVESISTYLMTFIESKFKPLKMIIKLLEDIRKKPVMKKITSTIREYGNKYISSEFDLMNRFSTIQKEYNYLCTSKYKYADYQLTEKHCKYMHQVVEVLSDLEFISQWLKDSIRLDYTTANKAYIICYELRSSIQRLSDLNQISIASGGLDSLNSEESTYLMNQTLEMMESTLEEYFTMIEKGGVHAEAFIFDSFAFNTTYYEKSIITDIRKGQRDQILRVFRPFIPVSTDTNPKLEGLTSTTRKRSCRASGNASGPATTKKARISKEEIKEKKDAPCTSEFKSKLRAQLRKFSKHQSSFMVKNPLFHSLPPPDKANIGEVATVITEKILCETSTYGQLNFWKEMTSDYFPLLAEQTKKAFAIPSTSSECVQALRAAKEIFYNFPSNRPSEKENVTHRVLLYSWKKDSELFVS